MATVTYDDRSFLLDGKRIWLVSGSVHYFRTPAPLWRDRLLKAKRSGLNCIDTYIAWNFHEMQEGRWDFSGERDISAFVRQAGELGLYVILRPGPYICAEWDFGGLPAWLTTKPGIAYRTSNAAYTHYYDKYFRQVLPRLAEQQVTRGGNIVLIQNENEYFMTTMPDRLNYLEFISQLFRRAGFEVPIVNCNVFSDPPVPDTVECANFWSHGVAQLKRLRLRQPNAPLMVTEFWPGWFDWWGHEHNTRDARETARRVLEALGCGSQFNYYMWHGGTNFAFWGSRLTSGSATWQTTSYDYDAPLAEGGGLTRKYYLTKLVNMLANYMGPYISSCAMADVGVSGHDCPGVLNISGPNGRWAVVTNNGRDEIKTATVSLPQGQLVTVSLELLGATAVPVGLKLPMDKTLEWANVMPLGVFHDRTLVFHAPPLWEANIRISGKDYKAAVPQEDEPLVLPAEELQIVLVNSELAMRTWFANDALVFGPTFVGESVEHLTHSPSGNDYFLMEADGKLQRKKQAKAHAAARHAAPHLAAWKLLKVCTEPVDSPQGKAGGPSDKDRRSAWQKIDRPKDVDSLGLHYGYVWYRAEVHSPKAARRRLFLPECADRATLFLNGDFLGVFGGGAGSSREPIAAGFSRGANVLTALLDNMGRFNFGPYIGEVKGLGHVYDARAIQPPRMKLKLLEGFARRIVPRRLVHMIEELERLPVWTAQFDVSMSRVAPVHITWRGVPHHAAILCNEHVAGFFPLVGEGFGDVTLGSELHKGRNRLEILLWGDVAPAVLKNIIFYSLDENITADASWSVCPWTLPPADAVPPSRRHPNHPAWFASRFRRPDSPEPLFLKLTGGASKGQIYLNGRNIGRFWTIGPQEHYYLPSCWLADENDLLLFDETGAGPLHSSLEIRPGGPYR
ncbi:MAG: beta-galactosidase [Phycisphaerae bacterium]